MYLLDTNVCIGLIDGRDPKLRRRFSSAQGTGVTLAVPSKVVHELWYGAAKSSRKAFNFERLEVFFSGPLEILAFEEEDGRAAGRVRANLERRGTPIGAYDVLIAGQALARAAVLVTSNVSEFSRVEGLDWEDWAAEPS